LATFALSSVSVIIFITSLSFNSTLIIRHSKPFVKGFRKKDFDKFLTIGEQKIATVILLCKLCPGAPLAGRIVIYVASPRSIKDLRFPGKMFLPPAMIRALEEAFGQENVSLVPGSARL
jgi:hypothetical protein